jgi:tripartite-type tricarboxylate transporter receptor subunit TctC
MQKHMLQALAVLALLLPCAQSLGQADTYPSRLVRIVHQYTAGGGNDLISRIIASGLSEPAARMKRAARNAGTGDPLAST